METCYFNTKSMFFNIVECLHDHRGSTPRLSCDAPTIIVRVAHDLLTSISLQFNLMLLTKLCWFARKLVHN